VGDPVVEVTKEVSAYDAKLPVGPAMQQVENAIVSAEVP
jgi:hypothetical protein